MSNPDLGELSLNLKKEALGNQSTIREFEPIRSEIDRVTSDGRNLKVGAISSGSCSPIMPYVCINRVTIESNPDSKSFLNDASINPHVSTTLGEKTSMDGVVVSNPANVSRLGSIRSSSDETMVVRLSLGIKQTLDDDSFLVDIVNTLGIEKFLRLKIIAIVDNPSLESRIQPLMQTPEWLSKVQTDSEQGIYVIGGRSGVPISYGVDRRSRIDNLESSPDGGILRNTPMVKEFVFNSQPREMVVYVQSYYDIFHNPEFEREMGATLGAMAMDADLTQALLGSPKSERIFQDGNLLSEATVFTALPPSAGPVGDPYMGPVLEVKPGYYAKPEFTTFSGEIGVRAHRHNYYIDERGNGWTSVHTDSRGQKHVHMIRSFQISPSGQYRDLEEKFLEDIESHSHGVPLAAPNALYRKKVPLDYYEDNRSKKSLSNLKLESDKSIETAFSFLREIRRSSNLIKSINDSSELSVFTTRQSKKRYFSNPMYSCDIQGNARFAFAFDYINWIKSNTLYGEYISDETMVQDYVKVQYLNIYRKKVTNQEYHKAKSLSRVDFDTATKFPERLICTAMPSNTRVPKSQIAGINDVAILTEFTPAGSQKSRSRPVRYFAVVDKGFTITGPSVLASRVSQRGLANEPPVSNAGLYVYGVEIGVIDNTLEYFKEAQGSLVANIKRLEDYISIGSRRGHYHGPAREFTGAFITKIMDDHARTIVDGTMRMLRRLFVDKKMKNPLSSPQSFTKKASQMYYAIRPSTGSLNAAEKYLAELRSIVAHLRAVTRSNEIGPYAKQRETPGSENSGITKSDLKIRKIRHYFKECFFKEDYLSLRVNCLPPSTGNDFALTQISLSEIEKMISRSPNKSLLKAPPLLAINKSGTRSPIDERFIKNSYFSESDAAPQQFSIVDNNSILEERLDKNTDKLTAVSLKNIMGTTDFEEQIRDLQEDGYLEDLRKTSLGNDRKSKRDLYSLVSGEELTESYKEFNYFNTHSVLYFDNFSGNRNFFVPRWRQLDNRSLKRLAAEGRPILCKLTRNGVFEALYKRNMFMVPNVIDRYFMIITDSGASLHSPASRREQPVFSGSTSPYAPEVATSNPMVSSRSHSGAQGSGSSGGGYS